MSQISFCRPQFSKYVKLVHIGIIDKGHLISEQIYAVLNFPQMQQNIARISALASKMGQIKKVKAHYHPN